MLIPWEDSAYLEKKKILLEINMFKKVMEST